MIDLYIQETTVIISRVKILKTEIKRDHHSKQSFTTLIETFYQKDYYNMEAPAMFNAPRD